MNPTHMDRILDLLKQEEVQDALRFVDLCKRNGNMDQQKADEWRRRFVARIVPTDA